MWMQESRKPPPPPRPPPPLKEMHWILQKGSPVQVVHWCSLASESAEAAIVIVFERIIISCTGNHLVKLIQASPIFDVVS